MKKTGLIITILVCVAIFLTTLTAGIVLTIQTIGWTALRDNDQLRAKIQEVADSLQDLDVGVRQVFTIDEIRTADLDGIDTIRISGVSEDITLQIGGSQVEARLKGTYRSVNQSIIWLAEKQGRELLIHAKYPVMSISFSNLAIQVQIPANYRGAVQVSTVSGDCRLPDSVDCAWSSFKHGSTSGDLAITRAAFPELVMSTVSGDINVQACQGKVSCNAISGNVAITWTAFAATSIESVSGSVNLALPASADCRLLFTTVSGDFSNHDLALQLTVQQKRRLEGTLNKGSQDLTVKTVSGSLVMKKS